MSMVRPSMTLPVARSWREASPRTVLKTRVKAGGGDRDRAERQGKVEGVEPVGQLPVVGDAVADGAAGEHDNEQDGAGDGLVQGGDQDLAAQVAVTRPSAPTEATCGLVER